MRAAFGGSGLVLSGNSSAGGGDAFVGTFTGGGFSDGNDNYFVTNAVRWVAEEPFYDLNGTTQTASEVNLGFGGISPGVLNFTGDVIIEGGFSEADLKGGAGSQMNLTEFASLSGDNDLPGGVFLGGESFFEGAPFGVFVNVGSDNALGQPGSTVQVDPLSAGIDEFFGIGAEDGSVNLSANIAMGDEPLEIEVFDGNVLTFSGVISGNDLGAGPEGPIPNLNVFGDRFSGSKVVLAMLTLGFILHVQYDILVVIQMLL